MTLDGVQNGVVGVAYITFVDTIESEKIDRS